MNMRILFCWMFPCSARRCWLGTRLTGQKPRRGSPVQRLPELSMPSKTGGPGRVSVSLWPSWASCPANRLPNVIISTARNIGFCLLSFALPFLSQHCLPMDKLHFGVAILDPSQFCCILWWKSWDSDCSPNSIRGRKVSQKLCHGCANICSFFSRVLASALLTY